MCTERAFLHICRKGVLSGFGALCGDGYRFLLQVAIDRRFGDPIVFHHRHNVLIDLPGDNVPFLNDPLTSH